MPMESTTKLNLNLILANNNNTNVFFHAENNEFLISHSYLA